MGKKGRTGVRAMATPFLVQPRMLQSNVRGPRGAAEHGPKEGTHTGKQDTEPSKLLVEEEPLWSFLWGRRGTRRRAIPPPLGRRPNQGRHR